MAIFDKPTRIGMWIALISGSAFIIIEPKQFGWRLLLLAIFGCGLAGFALESDWVNQRQEEYSIIGGDLSSSLRSPLRTTVATVGALLVTIIFGFATWEVNEMVSPESHTPVSISEDATSGPSSGSSVPIKNNPTELPKLPQPVADSGVKSEPARIAKGKSKPVSRKKLASEDPKKLIPELSDATLKQEADNMTRILKTAWDDYYHGPEWQLFEEAKTDDKRKKEKVEKQREQLRSKALSENRDNLSFAKAIRDECFRPERPDFVHQSGKELKAIIANFSDMEWSEREEHH
jgi:hypothetical protein